MAHEIDFGENDEFSIFAASSVEGDLLNHRRNKYVGEIVFIASTVYAACATAVGVIHEDSFLLYFGATSGVLSLGSGAVSLIERHRARACEERAVRYLCAPLEALPEFIDDFTQDLE